MKIVILCGGQGTRIRDAAENLPKPMLPIGDRPILWHIMRGYAAHGFNDFVLCLGYRGWQIKDYFLNYRAKVSDLTVRLGAEGSTELLGGNGEDELDWRVTLAETGEATMTGGRVVAVKKYLQDDDIFLLTYGDGVSDVNIADLVRFHRAHGKIATMTAVRPPGRFGEMRMERGVVREFNEKPQATEGFINGGFFVFDARRAWDYLKGGPELVLEHEPMRGLVRDSQLVAYEHTGFWQPMDTYREYMMLNDLWASGEAPWRPRQGTP